MLSILYTLFCPFLVEIHFAHVHIQVLQVLSYSKIIFQVNEILGKNHLFKHSILLVKAWCYYESRILGAHHGLLSTYAVEILVLYIINRYHASVRGPLEVGRVFHQYSPHPLSICIYIFVKI